MNNEPLLRVKCFLLDMDGTFNLGNELIYGSLRFINTLNELGIDYLFLTNNSSKRTRHSSQHISLQTWVRSLIGSRLNTLNSLL
jgi:ribonucleotide monophosphatase NagD (HAD superfamily)